MRGAEQRELVAEWRRLASTEQDQARRGDYGGLAKIFAELAGRREIWSAGLEGWNMEVSQVVLEWQAQARAEGEARGRAEALPVVRRNLLRALEVRLQVTPPADVVPAVESQGDPATLGRWFQAALAANSTEEVRAAFNLPN